MTDTDEITFGDLSREELERITRLSTSIQAHFAEIQQNTSVSEDFLQIHANPTEVDELFSEPIESEQINNNNRGDDPFMEPNNDPIISGNVQVNEFHSLTSVTDNEVRSTSSTDINKNTKKSKKGGKKSIEETPKPQRVILKAQKRKITTAKSKSLFDFFGPTQSESNLNVLNEGFLPSPSLSKITQDMFTFSGPISVVSLPTVNDKRVNEKTIGNDTTQKSQGTNTGASLENQKPTHAQPLKPKTPTPESITPNIIDQIMAGGSKAPTFPLTREELITPTNILQKGNSVVIESKRTPTSSNPPESEQDKLNIDFDVSNLIDQCNRQVNINLQTRLDVRIFSPALQVWRQLRNYQNKKITLEMRSAYHEKLIDTEHYPDWTVTFLPPVSLLGTPKSIKAVTEFRKHSAKEILQITNELMREERPRLTHEINVSLNSLRLHYEHTDAANYDIHEALESLSVFMRRMKENELAEVNKKYTAIHQAPLSAIWSGLPEGTIIPSEARRVFRQEGRTPTLLNKMDFHNAGRGTRCPFWRGGRRGTGQTTRGRGNCGRPIPRNQAR